MDQSNPRGKPQPASAEREPAEQAPKKRKKGLLPRNPIDPLSALMISAIIAHARSLGAGEHDLREFAEEFSKDLERQYDIKLLAQAVRRRRDWRKADVSKLVRLQRVGHASPNTLRRMAELEESKDSSGRGVLPEPKRFDQAFGESLALFWRLADPNTPVQERREIRKAMRKFPELVEAAYRGEHERVKPTPHASDIAEQNVADAAGISRAKVHQLCQQVRDEYERAEKRAAARNEYERANKPADDDLLLCGVMPEPTMTARELKQYLESGPARPGRVSETPGL